MTPPPQSPYARALGERIDDLHPRLRAYFEAIPDGAVGIGEGVFQRVGTPRRWLWPFLRLLERRGVVAAVWESDVPFRVENRTIASRAIGERTFHFDRGPWTMRDAAALTRHGRVVDELGEPGLVAACFDVEVHQGALHLVSRAVGLRLGRLRMRIPAPIAPLIRLTERFDDALDRQRMALTVDAPFLGRVYEYRGDFTYRIHHSEKEQTT
ncbi:MULTISPECIES: DUF4166 domain-containing protein [Microbacterium]|uniref:DUF4166 domain-containing protein n=1 Tax=Microbacterium maritypicum TaxID=33918 RepID=A0AAD3ZZ47_MICMQ|nr:MULTISPECIES: DUF4166 domain-containing protein [Microbacterium]AZS47949.1 hypothetical protein CVS53_02659 [Microbacterium oxydans]KAB1886685.1 DUF4166 domain-containing protein [Microbacterium liquefaciens]KQV01912.1 hypothetical protein ASC55_06240 [Microbacterium sp. Root322]WKT89457.1 DUF4166 domain-containing protein [Microbacterium liquefaciens]